MVWIGQGVLNKAKTARFGRGGVIAWLSAVCGTCRLAFQNGAFWLAKWHVSGCETTRFRVRNGAECKRAGAFKRFLRVGALPGAAMAAVGGGDIAWI